MKVLVIGGAGYIGSHVVLACLKKGYEVSVFDNFSTGCSENIFPGCVVYTADIIDSATLNNVMQKGFDAVIHLAASKAAGESMLVPEKYSTNNISGTLNILNAVSNAGIKTIIFSSSAAVYGEPKYLPIDENHPAIPLNYYGYTKLMIEGFMDWYYRLRSINYAALRYFNAAGYDTGGRVRGLEKNPANLLPVIMEIAAGKRKKLDIFGDDYPTKDGTGVRDYIHVTDLADAHIKSLEYVKKTGQNLIVNLGSDAGISVIEMLSAARKITGAPIPSVIMGRRPGDPAELYATSKKANELLGWKAGHSDVDTLVSSTWSVYKQLAV